MKDIKFEYYKEILYNMSKIPYYYKGDMKLYNNYYYLEYTGIITDSDLKNKETGNFIFQKFM